MLPLRSALNYLRYYISASNGRGHGIHSPFVFQFVTNVMNDRRQYPDYGQVEALRRELLGRKETIPVLDLGAGANRAALRSVRSIALRSLKSPKYAQLLYRMARYFQPQTVLELGTSLGITTSYLALAVPTARVITLEGAPEIARLAMQQFDRQGLRNVGLVLGNFDDTLSEVLAGTPGLDLVFLDGNHRLEPTMRYFSQILPHLHEGSVLVVDDIHWSREMEEAWKGLSGHTAVTCTVDLYAFGLLFFRSEFREKQHFVIRF